MTPVGEVFLAIFLTLCSFAALVAFCKFFCKNDPVTCEHPLAAFPLAAFRAPLRISLDAHDLQPNTMSTARTTRNGCTRGGLPGVAGTRSRRLRTTAKRA